MDAILLARIQFALTIAFHFLFPPLTIGLAWLIVWIMNRYRRTGEALYYQMARFWVRLFGLSFAIGVASGIVMEFQFGTNWATYSRYVGDIFGAPLAAEALLAFFLESIFVGVLLFGWNKLSRTGMFVAALLVAIGSTLSAFWIIVANSWMQTPAGFVLRNGRAELTDFWAAVFNPSTLPRYLHTVDGALITGAFFMVGISAWLLLRDRTSKPARLSLTLGLWVAFAASLLELFAGHFHAMQVAATQPAKLAAFECLYQTQARAPLALFGIPNPANETLDFAVSLPTGLSILAFNDPNAVVTGLRDIKPTERPPVALSFYSFHLMVILGGFFLAFTALGVWLLKRKTLFDQTLFLRAAVWAIPLPFIAMNIGWMAAEVGRQPWIVQGLLLTKDAVSVTVPAWQILASICMFTVLYLVLLVAWFRFLRRALEQGMTVAAPESALEVAQ